MSSSNRHERRRAMKVYKVEQTTMTAKELSRIPVMCAWAGCGAGTTEPQKHGWSNMLLYKGKPRMNFFSIDPRLMARDSALCPEHARYLDEHLLIDIGGSLRFVAGAA